MNSKYSNTMQKKKKTSRNFHSKFEFVKWIKDVIDRRKSFSQIRMRILLGRKKLTSWIQPKGRSINDTVGLRPRWFDWRISGKRTSVPSTCTSLTNPLLPLHSTKKNQISRKRQIFQSSTLKMNKIQSSCWKILPRKNNFFLVVVARERKTQVEGKSIFKVDYIFIPSAFLPSSQDFCRGKCLRTSIMKYW